MANPLYNLAATVAAASPIVDQGGEDPLQDQGRSSPSSPETQRRGKRGRSDDAGTGRSYDASDAGDMHSEEYYNEC